MLKNNLLHLIPVDVIHHLEIFKIPKDITSCKNKREITVRKLFLEMTRLYYFNCEHVRNQ